MKTIATILFSLGLLSSTFAQLPAVDITMVSLESGQLEVRMRPDSDFNGFFASLVFTVKWNAASPASLGSFTSTPQSMAYGMWPAISGEMAIVDGSKYVTFAGFGNQPLSSVGQNWLAGEEFVIGHFNVVSGPANFQLVNDAHTASVNGNFFVSLNGQDRTGDIYETLSTRVDDVERAHTFSLSPNPSTAHSQVLLELIGSGQVSLEIFDAAGRSVRQRTLSGTAGPFRVDLDGGDLAVGTYTVRVIAPGIHTTRSWVIAGH